MYLQHKRNNMVGTTGNTIDSKNFPFKTNYIFAGRGNKEVYIHTCMHKITSRQDMFGVQIIYVL